MSGGLLNFKSNRSAQVFGRIGAMNEMQRPTPHELLEASDDFIDDAVQYADPMVLRGLIYQPTGDREIADTELTMIARWARRTRG